MFRKPTAHRGEAELSQSYNFEETRSVHFYSFDERFELERCGTTSKYMPHYTWSTDNHMTWGRNALHLSA